MHLLILGRGKTGSLVAEVARERRHHIETLSDVENANARALTLDFLAPFDSVIDFTEPAAVVPNAEACIRAGKSIVVGTTGWYDRIPQLRERVLAAKTGFLYGSNFSIGVNLFFEIAQTAAAALKFDYSGQIFERHHAQKKDAPSGTAANMRDIIEQASGAKLEITSIREGEIFGTHALQLESDDDIITLTHDAKSRRGFAQGAVCGAEWLIGKTGFYEFKDVWREL